MSRTQKASQTLHEYYAELRYVGSRKDDKGRIKEDVMRNKHAVTGIMKICTLCGVSGGESAFVRASSQKNIMILLSVLLEQRSIELARAWTWLKECPARRKRICAEHSDEAAAFLDVRPERLKNVPSVLEQHWLALDKICKPTRRTIRAFIWCCHRRRSDLSRLAVLGKQNKMLCRSQIQAEQSAAAACKLIGLIGAYVFPVTAASPQPPSSASRTLPNCHSSQRETPSRGAVPAPVTSVQSSRFQRTGQSTSRQERSLFEGPITRARSKKLGLSSETDKEARYNPSDQAVRLSANRGTSGTRRLVANTPRAGAIAKTPHPPTVTEMTEVASSCGVVPINTGGTTAKKTSAQQVILHMFR
ncbi:unnamed protein product [Haemonchus placei]|uniref:Uncharacterized protein n=1 Tax=Haemonchus placei TaxID=6290 RepID=A0A0N4X061_HAEPC|nr:unnamed protein product [Haemonchus placei]